MPSRDIISKVNHSLNSSFFFLLQKTLSFLFSFLFLISPFLVDVKITRPKLMILEVGITAIFFLWLFLSVINSEELLLAKNPVFLPVAVYSLAIVFFYLFSPNQPLSYTELRRVLLFGVTFVLASNLLDSGIKQRFFILCFIVGTLWASVYGILQRSGGFWRISVPQMDRVFSTFGNPIFFGVYLVLAIPIIFGFLIDTKYISLKILSTITIIFSLIALYYTETRASWLGLGLGAFLFIVLSIRDLTKKIAIISLLIILGVIFFYLTRDVWSRHQAHLLIWRDTLNMWLSSPVVGVGVGLFHINFPAFASKELLKIWPQTANIINDAHNEYIQILSETGIVGFSLFVWFIITFLYTSYINITCCRRRNYLNIGMLCGVVALLSQNVFSVDMRFIISGIYLFAFMGMSLVTEGQKKSVVVIRSRAFRIFIGCLIIAISYFVFMEVLKPYSAVKVESKKVDFFDEKILNAAKTIEELESLSKKHPEQFSIYEKLGWIYAKEKNFAKAIENYKKAISLKPENPGPYNNIGNIYFLTNQHSKAIEYYLRSISVKPQQIDARINLALAYYYKGQLGPAAEQLKEVLKLEPHNEKAIVLMKKMKE